MAKLPVIFCHGDDFVSNAIQFVEDGHYSHVAGLILDSTLEALGVKDEGDIYPGVWLHPADKYSEDSDHVFIHVEVPDIEAAKAEARILIGRFYGYGDCIRGGLMELFNKEVEGNAITANCSEVWTRVLRAGGVNILPDLDADCVTPQMLYDVLVEYVG